MCNHDPGCGQEKVQSTDRIVAANKDGRGEIAAHAAEWLKESDVPSVAVAFIKDRRLARTAVYGEQFPGVAATGKTLYNMASLTKPVTAETVLRLASAGKFSLDESMSPFWLDPDIKNDPWSKLLTPRLCLSHQTGFANWRRMTGGVLKIRWEPGTQTGYSGEGQLRWQVCEVLVCGADGGSPRPEGRETYRPNRTSLEWR
jgi:CubicO group peptidase (beta-lactamase class C family)